MALPDAVRDQATLLLFAFCHVRSPEDTLDRYHLALRIRNDAATIYECFGPERFPKFNRRPAAQFRYDQSRQTWTLYWADHKQRWQLYDKAQPTAELADLIKIVHLDPTGVFFP